MDSNFLVFPHINFEQIQTQVALQPTEQLNLLSSWKYDSVVNITFDSTASNTGHVTAAGFTIQQQLSKSLLLSACHHHVGEAILSHVFHDLKIETSKSNVIVFSRFSYTLSF